VEVYRVLDVWVEAGFVDRLIVVDGVDQVSDSGTSPYSSEVINGMKLTFASL
jgi:Fe2+ or Zn2+ uptake regulation protein